MRCLVRYSSGAVKQSVIPPGDWRMSEAMRVHGVSAVVLPPEPRCVCVWVWVWVCCHSQPFLKLSRDVAARGILKSIPYLRQSFNAVHQFLSVTPSPASSYNASMLCVYPGTSSAALHRCVLLTAGWLRTWTTMSLTIR